MSNMNNMNNIMMKLFMVILLMMFSMGAEADVKVLFGENGDDVFSGKGGTIEVSQEPDEKDETKVIVTLTVTPKKNYSISKDDIKVYAVLPASVRSTRGLEISNELTLDGKDPQNLSEKRDYTVTLDSKLNLWVRTATFTNLRKGGGATLTCYIANNGGYNQSTTTNNFYMVPAADPHQTNYNDAYYSANYNLAKGDPERPFITTYKTDCDNNSVWQIISTDDGHFYIKHWATGKYLIYEPPYSNLINRKSVHLQTTTSPGDNAKFDIITTGNEELDLDDLDLESLASKNYDIIPISLTSGNRYLNPAKDNANNYYGSGSDNNAGGLIGVWKETTGNSIWHLEETVLPPTFTVNADGTVEISSVTGTTVHYLTDGNNPTATDGEYDGAITPTNEISVIKAIAVRETDGKVSAVVTLPLQTYTYYIVNRSGDIAVKCELKQPVGKTLSSYLDIPAAIQSPYLDGETVLFYSFDEAYSSTDQLSDENQISKTPATDANIYVTYTTTGLSEKFLKLRGASAFNITESNNCIYDDSGTLASETADYSTDITTANHLWKFTGEDPYAVQISNLGTSKYLVFSTPPTLELAATATNSFIIMAGSASGDGTTYEQINLMAATGDGTPNYTKKEIKAYPVSASTNYYLIDKAGNVVFGPQESESSELSIPEEWVSPLVSEYHYWKGATLNGNTIGSSCDMSTATPIESPFDVASGENIYVTYDVSDVINLEGGKTYLLKFHNGVDFFQEDQKDGVETTATKAMYPYNNGDFNLYVYGKAQWDKQLSDGASTRSRWLWKIVSYDNSNDSYLTGNNVDPYHVRIKSNQNQSIKVTKNNVETSYPGASYLRTYKPNNDVGVITGVAYENTTYPDSKPDFSALSPTEYMILGTSLDNMILMSFNEIEGARQIVSAFEQYWKNSPTVETIAGTANPDANNSTLTGRNWHRYQQWAFSAPWGGGSKELALNDHWFQTISMGTGENAGKFAIEEVNLAPQVILIDQHGWEIMRTPLSDLETLRKYDSPMVDTYYWYPFTVESKVTGYHKYSVKNISSEIKIYKYGEKPNDPGKYDWIDSGQRYTHTSHTLADSPYSRITTPNCEKPNCSDASHNTQPDKVKTDFLVVYTVKSDYTKAYTGAATEDATEATPFLLKQGGNYAKTENGSTITTTSVAPARLEDAADNMQWYLRPNFNIDVEMGYKYDVKANDNDLEPISKAATNQTYFDDGHAGFDPYNVQIQSKAYPLRFFTTNTTGSALDGGAWTGTSSSVTLQNMTTTNRQTATGYDQTTLNITNATFMVVNDGIVDGNGVAINMRLVPRFDNSHAVTFNASSQDVTLNTPLSRTPVDNDATGTQTLQIDLISPPTVVHNRSEITSMNGYYLLDEDFDFTGFTSLGSSDTPFTGTIDGQLNTLEGLGVPLVAYAQDAIIKNVMLKEVTISQTGYVGAIACTATGNTRIYNCGILPTTAAHAAEGRSTVTSTNNHCGGLVGFLDGYARVINCFSYANVSAPTNNNKIAGGLVGNNTTATTQGISETNFNNNCKTMVVNCMFYGDITQGNIKRPVYGGTAFANNDQHKVNNYNYFCEEEVSFEASLDQLSKYFYTWPVAKKYLTRYDVYRNILNSNRRLCTWWVDGAYNTAPTDANVESVGIAKWVLDLSVAPYPILKKWGKYPSVINKNPDQRVNPSTKVWEDRGDASAHWGKNMAPDTEGQILGSITVSIDAGSHHNGTDSRTINITAMDKEYNDYCYGKIQLPYYNEIFGNPNESTWSAKYGDNYTDMVVTGWEITTVTADSRDRNSFSADWESGYNFADRSCIDKDLYGTSGRVFAQGGYYYVPDGVTAIKITAHWGNAVYLCNKNYRLDMVNNAAHEFYNAGALSFGSTSGILPLWPSGNTLKTSLDDAIDGLSINPTGSVYDQAIVLVGNYQNNNIQGGANNTSKLILSGNEYDTKAKPFTIMSADFDFDNEPDFCFQAGMNNGGRPNVQPIRFDFLMVPDITMAIRKSADYLGMRIICPQGHFEVTETSYMYITQFEYDKRGNTTHNKHEAPVILNGGEFFQIVSKEQVNNDISTNPSTLSTWECDRTSYFLLGGNLWMKAFTPGVHGNGRVSTRHCAVNAIGGEFPEFYLSGMFRTDFYNKTDNPHAYLDGGKFGIVAGAGMESVGGKNETNGGNVTFKINHSLIDEFYGGGINAQRPVTGNINVTIDNSKVLKYCGGPKLGDMSNTKTITTNATGTTFDEYYGGGNGGTNLLRERMSDAGAGTDAPTKEDHSKWDRASTGNGQDANYGGYFDAFTPFKYDANKGYQAEYEFEMLPRTSGNSKVITRSYYYWASFSKTTVAPITNTITDCTFNGNFYGGGNLGAVDSPTSSTDPAISSTLSGHTVVHGSAFGAGYSASATSFKVHDKSTVVYPYRDNSGFIHDGSLDYEKISDEPLVYKEYTWIHDIPADWNVSPAPSVDNPTFTHGDKSYCYTPVSLEGLGTVTGDVSLTIEGNTVVMGKIVNMTKDAEGNNIITYGAQTGGAFGGGDASGVVGNTTVVINAPEQQTSEGYNYNTYNVFGGGNKAQVDGDSEVYLYNGIIDKDVFGGGNEAVVTGTATVNLVTPPSNNNGSRGASGGSGEGTGEVNIKE